MRLPILAIAAAAICCCSCGSAPPEVTDLAAARESIPRPVPKVVLIGLDGADWNVMRPLIDEGRLPVLASLVGDGASGDLVSLHPMLSPALWTTVVTGVGAERHGIHDFVYKKAGSYSQPIVSSSVRERLAVWNILSALDMTVGIVDWYATWPAERVNGFVVSDRIKTLGPDSEGVTFPNDASLQKAIVSVIPPGPTELPALARLTQRFERLPIGLDKALKEDLYRYGLARELYREHRPDFFAFYLKGIDAVGHFYWKYYEPEAEQFGEVDPRHVELMGSIIPQYYELCDALLGDFLDGLDDSTTVIVVSDHGFRAFGRPDNLIFDLDRLFSVMGLLEFEDARLADERNERKIDMAATRAYTHSGTKIISTFGRRDRPVYLNVSGRDPEGVIEQASWKQTREEIRNRLTSLKTDLGSRVFSEVRVHDGTADSSRGQQEADLILRLNREIAFDYEVLIGDQSYSLYDLLLWEYDNISGTHRDKGIFIARGPTIRAGATVKTASLLDITPTILHLTGAPMARDLDGKVIRDMFTDGQRATPMTVASYEPLIERERSVSDGDAPEDEAYKDRLRALGYVE